MKTTIPDEVAERICEAFWNRCRNGETLDGVNIHDVYQHNACNHTISGTVIHEGRLMGFIVESGDWNGFVVKEWGESEDVGTYQPCDPGEQLTFVPVDPLNISQAMVDVYLHWRNEPWFKEKVGSYLYDRHFQPGGFVEHHYHQWAATKGLAIGLVSNLPPAMIEQIERKEGPK